MTTRDVLIDRLVFNSSIGSKYQEFLHPRLKGKWRTKGGPQRTISPAAHSTAGAQATAPSGQAATAAISVKPDEPGAAGGYSWRTDKERRGRRGGGDPRARLAYDAQ